VIRGCATGGGSSNTGETLDPLAQMVMKFPEHKSLSSLRDSDPSQFLPRTPLRYVRG
jgi:hypothetical protein